jgi:hypothetical protein
MLSESVSWIEVVWTLVSAVGLFFALVNLREVLADYRAVQTVVPRNGRHMLAKAAVRIEAQRVFSQVGYITIGICSMLLVTDFTEPPRTIIGIILIVLGLAQTVHSMLDAILRRELVRQGHGPHGVENGGLPGQDASSSPVAEHTHHLATEQTRPTSSGPVE